jgi:hypothetical protein
MITPAVDEFYGRTFRAGRAYDLVVYDRLPVEEQAGLSELRADPEFYGVLRPTAGTTGTVKSVRKDTALLWLTLQSPGPLPFFVLSNLTPDHLSNISRLILDGVLEMEENGHFVAGPDAIRLIAKEVGPVRKSSEGRIPMMSKAAVHYGENLRLKDARQLAIRLYGFGRLPLTPKLARELPDSQAVCRYLGIDDRGVIRPDLDKDWQQSPNTNMPGWLVWSRKSRITRIIAGASCKLYISPTPEALAAAFGIILNCLTRRAAHFKIGNDAAGLLRPDKMIAYFHNQEDLLAAASELSRRLEGTPAHGVPFSAEIGTDGLLSWGMDPPPTERLLSWQEPESWRLWVVRRLAATMVAAGSGINTNVGSGNFALERLRLEGVDVDHWIPAATMWQ